MVKGKVDPAVILIGLMILGAVVFGVVLVLQLQKDTVSIAAAEDGEFSVLIVLTNGGALEFSQILTVNPQTHRAALFDIPYNLGLILDSLQRVDRITAVYDELGIEAYLTAVRRFFAHPVRFVMEMELRDFREVTDLLGGIQVSLGQAIDVNDDGEIVRIPSGTNVLDGEKILGLLSFFTSDQSPVDRTDRLFMVLRGFFERVGAQAELLSRPRAAELLRWRIKENMDERGLQTFVSILAQIDFQRIFTQRVLGVERTPEGGVPLLFPHSDGQIARDLIKQISAILQQEVVEGAMLADIRVQILNGTRVNGLARRTESLLAGYGLQIAEVGNAASQDVENTQVVYTDNAEAARQVADLLRVKEITQGGATAGSYDVSIILGRDFDGWYVR